MVVVPGLDDAAVDLLEDDEAEPVEAVVVDEDDELDCVAITVETAMNSDTATATTRVRSTRTRRRRTARRSARLGAAVA